MTISPNLDIEQVRAEELKEIVSRRFKANTYSPAKLASLLHSWSRSGILPSSIFKEFIDELLQHNKLTEKELIKLEKDWLGPKNAKITPAAWSSDKLCEIVAEHLDANDLGSRKAIRIFKCWKQLGLLPGVEFDETQDQAVLELLCKSVEENSPMGRLKLSIKNWRLEEVKKELDDQLIRQYSNSWRETIQESMPSNDPEADYENQQGDFKRNRYTPELCQELLLRALILEALIRRETKDNLFGLALSGGGIRSASFNLGLVQALAQEEVFPEIDYMSTVSGGGYIGSYVSASMTLEDANVRQLPISVKKNRPQPEAVINLLRGGKYLKRPLLLFDQYLIGLILNNVALLSGLIFICTCLAYAWRALDAPTMHRWLTWVSGGRILDANRCFVPACVLLVLWLLFWSVKGIKSAYKSYGLLGRFAWLILVPSVLSFILAAWNHFFVAETRRLDIASLIIIWVSLVIFFMTIHFLSLLLKRRRDMLEFGNWFRLRLLAMAVISFLLGITVWLANPNINFRTASEERLPGDSLYLTSHEAYLPYLMFLIVIGLLPFLRPRDLMISGETSNKHWKHWVFRAASTAFLLGIPMLIVFGLARHNISGVATTLGREMVDSDIQDWKKFWETARREHEEAKTTPAAKLWHHLDHHHNTTKIEKNLEQIEKIESNHKEHGKIKGEEFSLADLKKLERLKRETMTSVNSVLELKLFTNEQLSQSSVGTAIYNLAQSADEKIQFTTGELSNERESKVLRERVEDTIAKDRSSVKDKRTLNHLLLRAYYPDLIRNVTYIRRTVMIEADQQVRLYVLTISFCFFVFFGLLVNLNATSPQRFYRRQLRAAYIKPALPEGQEDLPLHNLKLATANGAPYHLISATLNMIASTDKQVLPTSSFLFSQRFCGSTVTGYSRTRNYAMQIHEGLSLADAMSISGAAVSPLHVKNALIAFVMTVFNLRLGQWLPNPTQGRFHWMRKPTILNVLFDWLVNRFGKNERRRFCLVTDGGHNENLGLGQLLRRECSFIIASDAGQDREHDFTDFAKLYRRSRQRGIRFEELDRSEFLDMGPLSLNSNDRKRTSKLQYVLTHVYYPGNQRPALMIYLKPSFVGKEEVDLLHHRREHDDFPHDPTANQLYDEEKIESYRQLGYTIGLAVCKKKVDLNQSEKELGKINKNIKKLPSVLSDIPEQAEK